MNLLLHEVEYQNLFFFFSWHKNRMNLLLHEVGIKKEKEMKGCKKLTSVSAFAGALGVVLTKVKFCLQIVLRSPKDSNLEKHDPHHQRCSKVERDIFHSCASLAQDVNS